MSAISKKITARLGTTMAAVVLATTGIVGLAASPAQAAADGYLYAWQHDNRGGTVCMWDGADGDWSNCGTHGSTSGSNMRNKASSVHNNGYSHHARLFYTGGSGSAYACLRVGTAWLEMNRQGDNGPRFNFGGTSGRGLLLNDNIARHTWNQTCD